MANLFIKGSIGARVPRLESNGTPRVPEFPLPQQPARFWSWQDKAACRGFPRLFFGPDFERPQEREKRESLAKAICARCPVRAACLEHALSVPEKAGIWGGQSADDRVDEKQRAVRDRERRRQTEKRAASRAAARAALQACAAESAEAS